MVFYSLSFSRRRNGDAYIFSPSTCSWGYAVKFLPLGLAPPWSETRRRRGRGCFACVIPCLTRDPFHLAPRFTWGFSISFSPAACGRGLAVADTATSFFSSFVIASAARQSLFLSFLRKQESTQHTNLIDGNYYFWENWKTRKKGIMAV